MIHALLHSVLEIGIFLYVIQVVQPSGHVSPVEVFFLGPVRKVYTGKRELDAERLGYIFKPGFPPIRCPECSVNYPRPKGRELLVVASTESHVLTQ